MAHADPSLDELDPAAERRLAAALFNHTWTLLDRPDRTPGQDVELIHAAHAARHHWGRVGTAVNVARSEWQVSRVYSVLGRPEPALVHARLCLEAVERGGLGAFDRACAHEALARAHRAAGDGDGCRREVALADAELAAVDDAEDRGVAAGDLADLRDA